MRSTVDSASFGEVEVAEFHLVPFDEAEACAGLRVPLGDIPAPAGVGAKQLGAGEDVVVVVDILVRSDLGNLVSELLGHELVSAVSTKVVLAIKDGRATIGVQGPSSDPHIESFDGPDLSGLAQEVPAVIERARARWEDEPKYPAHARPTPSTRGRGRREQSSAKDSTAEGDAAQPQPETLKLF